MASPLRPDPPEHHRPSHAADFARGDSLDRPVGRLPGPHQRWGTRRANPLAGLAPTGGCGWDVALVASGFLCVYLWVMISLAVGAGVVWRWVGTLASPLRGLLYPNRILSPRRAIAHTWIVNPWPGRRKRPHSSPLLPRPYACWHPSWHP